MVSVAQLVESRIVIPVVVGSSPIIHPILLYSKVISEQRLTNLKLVDIVFINLLHRCKPSAKLENSIPYSILKALSHKFKIQFRSRHIQGSINRTSTTSWNCSQYRRASTHTTIKKISALNNEPKLLLHVANQVVLKLYPQAGKMT
jgi:hypothetical protein